MSASISASACDEVVDRLGGVADGSSMLSVGERRHVETCLRCQADLVQYRRLLRGLRSLRTDLLEPSPSLLADVLASLEEVGERHAVRALLQGRRGAYLGGIAAATAAGAAGAIVIAARSRRLRPAS